MKKLFIVTALFLFLGSLVIAKTFNPKITEAETGSPKPKTIEVKDKVFCGSDDKPTTVPVAGEERIYTAIGCIPVSSTQKFIKWILGWVIGIGGGIALMLIIVASFQIMTSSGNPEKVQAGKELLTSAIAGLIMLIFSVFILKFIGIDILKLPGLE